MVYCLNFGRFQSSVAEDPIYLTHNIASMYLPVTMSYCIPEEWYLHIPYTYFINLSSYKTRWYWRN